MLDAGVPRRRGRSPRGCSRPVTEADFGEEALLRLGLEGAARFEAFCDELAEASGRDPGLHRSGTLVVARDRDDADLLDRLHALQRSLGLAAERLLPTAARRAEPALAPTIRLALDVPGDHSVDPRVPGRRARRGGRARRRRRAGRGAGGGARRRTGDRVTGVRLAGGERVEADAVVVAAGAVVARSSTGSRTARACPSAR